MIHISPSQLIKSFDSRKNWAIEYFSPWVFDQPFVVSQKRNREIKQVQEIIFKCIVHYVGNYEKYAHLLPISIEVKKLLSYFKDTPYTPGSYRADFVIDKENKFKIIEFTCRFPFNGFTLSGFLDALNEDYIKENDLEVEYPFNDFLTYIANKFIGKKIRIISHEGEKHEESRFYIPLLKEAGLDVKKIYVADLDQELDLPEDMIILTEFTQDQYLALSDETLMKLAKTNMINDIRTIFLIHDKRFFSLLSKAEFLDDIITEREKKILEQYIVPTYHLEEHPLLWEEAKNNKDAWIIKPSALGKSAHIYAGIITTEKVWLEQFENSETLNFVLQPFISQNTFEGHVNGKPYKDYFVGTLLFFDNQYFGPGFVRASSHPITNVVDDRKVMSISIKKDEQDLAPCYFF